ncbi:MAG: Arc family DNA-binding protein [Pseudomonadales bacterium]|nr:Arc family DNA-binding protein [Pseudomonadales bacterium]
MSTSNRDDAVFPHSNDGNGESNDSPDKSKPYKFVVRLPTEMRDRIAEAAQDHRRSMNSEIVARLERTFSGLPSEADAVLIEPPLQGHMDALLRRSYSDEEQQLLRTFRRLSLPKKRALLDLLK